MNGGAFQTIGALLQGQLILKGSKVYIFRDLILCRKRANFFALRRETFECATVLSLHTLLKITEQ